MKTKFILALILILTIACSGVAPTAVDPSPVPSQTLPAATAQTVTPTVPPTILPTLTLLPTATASPSPTPAPPNTQTPTATILPSSTPVANTATNTAVVPPASVEVDFINVGQGDAILIQSSDGTNVVIDGGEQGSGELQYLQSKKVSKIDLMFATHPHSDHIGGLVDVLNAIPTSEVVTNGQAHTTGVYEKFLDGIANAKAEYVEAKRGDTVKAGSLTFEVLSPVTAVGDDLNNNSLVLRLVVGKVVILFTGDAQTDAEGSMVAAGLPLKADILKVGHHGSTTSSSATFLNLVRPAVAVYMAGLNNQYNHPRPETLAALTAIGAKIYGTDVNGTIVVTTDGNSYQVKTAKTAPQPEASPQPTAPSAGSTTLAISVTSPVRAGSTATLTATAAPGASCDITVYYKSGPSKAAGLDPKTADGSGNVSWSWKVGASTSAGDWRIVVSCGDMTKETTFTVTK